MYLNFYNYLIVKLPINYRLNYYQNFEVDRKPDNFKGIFLEISIVNRISKKNHIFVSNYMSYDDANIFLIDKNGKYSQSIFNKMRDQNISLLIEDGYDKDYLLNYTIKPLLRDTLIKNNCAMIHASSFKIKNVTSLICAWAHTGKTNFLIRNLLDGGEFFGDDITIIDENLNILPYPVPINLFYYNLKSFPEINKKIKFSQKIKFFITSFISKCFNIMNNLSRSSKMKYLFYAGKTFFDSASHIAFDFRNNNEINFNKNKVQNVILLERSVSKSNSFYKKTPMKDDDLFASRMQECINYEFQRFNELIASANWVPFYDSDEFEVNGEKNIYKKFAEKINIYSVIIPQNYDFNKNNL